MEAIDVEWKEKRPLDLKRRRELIREVQTVGDVPEGYVAMPKALFRYYSEVEKRLQEMEDNLTEWIAQGKRLEEQSDMRVRLYSMLVDRTDDEKDRAVEELLRTRKEIREVRKLLDMHEKEMEAIRKHPFLSAMKLILGR